MTGAQRPTVPAPPRRRLEGELIGCMGRPAGLPLGAGAQAVVQLVGGEEDDDAARRQRLEQVRRAVDRHRLLRVALADGRARERGEVDDGIGRDGTDQRLGGGRVAQIERPRRHLREILGKRIGAAERAGHLELVAERGAEVLAEEAGGAGDEDLHGDVPGESQSCYPIAARYTARS